MDATELAVKMLKWEQAQKEADTLSAEIQAAVLDIGKTQTVGNVRASYSAGRKSYDYQAAAQNMPASIIQEYTTIREVIAWRDICSGQGIKDIPFTQSEPSVVVKLLTVE